MSERFLLFSSSLFTRRYGCRREFLAVDRHGRRHDNSGRVPRDSARVGQLCRADQVRLHALASARVQPDLSEHVHDRLLYRRLDSSRSRGQPMDIRHHRWHVSLHFACRFGNYVYNVAKRALNE